MYLFKNKYKTESNRLKNWDYSSEAIYFITMVSRNRECIFGVIDDDKMVLIENGKIIEKELLKSIGIRGRWFFHNWVIMPNHIHLLIEIKIDSSSNVKTHDVETHCSASLHQCKSQREWESERGYEHEPQLNPKKISRKPNSISSFVAVFKSVTTKQINLLIENNDGESVWQTNYHDHIVRNYNSLDTIYYYIKNNPKNWNTDSINID
ncbi:transposase [Flavobacterium soyangense]|uniref:Transposase n=1 Tax=Flavobacterium soyangense TaxID=2023265 RepID=A0A930UD57_9FLAO|nr:transposase [Flavobacterium soyangense]MBF2708569.1 transposase [Flavobacterium soyangense]